MPTKYDPATGEVFDPADASSGASGATGGTRSPWRAGPGRPKRVRTPEEEAFAAEQARFKAAATDALELLSPSLEAEGDPPLRRATLQILPAAEVATLLKAPRTTGRGLPGSALCLSERRSTEQPYVLAHVEYFDRGFRCRTQGTAIRFEEVRAVARALLEWANRVGAP